MHLRNLLVTVTVGLQQPFAGFIAEVFTIVFKGIDNQPAVTLYEKKVGEWN